MSEQPPDLPMDDPVEVNPIDEMEFDLPIPDGLTPEFIQARLEEPSGFFDVVDDQGDVTTIETGHVVDPGVEKKWDDPVELQRRGEQAQEGGEAE